MKKADLSHVLSGAALGMALLAIRPAQAAQTPLSSLRTPDMTTLSSRLQDAFVQTKIVCFGRFLITVPAKTKVVFGRMTVGAEIFFLADESGEIDRHVEAQRAKIEEAFDYRDKRLQAPESIFGKVLNGEVPGHKLLVGLDSNGYSLFSFVPLSTGLFVFEDKGFMGVEPAKHIAEHNHIARLLRPRPDNEIPSGNGVCLDGGFIDHNDEFENTSIGFRLEDFPDVHLSLQLRKNREFVYADPDLESRIKNQEQTAREEGMGKWWDSIRMLRRGPRTLLEWRGQEAASWKPARPGFHEASHEFLFWSPGQANDPYHPLIEAQFHTGVKGNKRAAVAPSLSDEEAVALWDKLLGSIRVRPAAAPTAKKVDAMPGTVVRAGQPCPQTGWWGCLDPAQYGSDVKMQGGALQYLYEGAAMPQARLLKRNWWQNFVGTGASFESAFPSQWQLSSRRSRTRLAYPDDDADDL